MYYDMKRGITGKDAMNLLRETAFSFVTESTFVDQDSIERTATKLCIHLNKRLIEALPTETQPSKQQHSAKRKALVVDEDTDFLSEGEPAPLGPNKRKRSEPAPQTPDRHYHLGARNGLLTPPSTARQQSVLPPKRLQAIISQPLVLTPKWLPPVAYRAFSSRSQGSYSEEQGFCAGAFVNSEVPLPPDPQSQEYIDEAKRHVAPIPTGPTPFISTTTSVVRAIHRALKLGPDASICVLSLELADTEGRVQSACNLRLQHLVNHFYVPFNEFLIYGKISPSAILSIMPISRILAALPSMSSDTDPFKILLLRDSKSLRPGRVAHRKARLPLSYGLGYAVGKLAQCLGIPYVQPIWDYAIVKLVVDFRLGEGLDRRTKWDDLNEIFQNAVKQGYQSQERATLTELEGRKGTTITRRIEGQASDSVRLDGAGNIPNSDLSTDDDEISICERMPDIFKYSATRDVKVSASDEAVTQEEYLNKVNALRDHQTLYNSHGRPPNRPTPSKRSSQQDTVPEEGSGIGAVREASPLNNLRVHNIINGKYAVRPKIVDTPHTLPPSQLPPSDQHENGQTKTGERYEYSWTGM